MRLLLRSYLALGGVTVALGAILGPDPSLASIPWAIASFMAAAAVVLGIRHHRPARPRFWIACACAFASWSAAAAIYPLAGLYASANGYHLDDLLWAPGYVGLTVASVSLVRRLGGMRVAAIDAAIGALALSSFLWTLVFRPLLATSHDVGSVAAALFPLSDVVLMLLVLRLLSSAAARLPAVRFLAAATTCLVVCDVAYFSPLIANDRLSARLIGAGYAFSYVLFGAAALHRSMRRVSTRRTPHEGMTVRRLLVALGCAPLTLPVAVVFDKLVTGHTDAVPLAIVGAATMALVLVRIAGLIRHLDALRRRAEASEQRFKMIFDSAAHGIAIGSSGMMTETNVALQDMLGYPGSELAQLHYTETTHPDDRAIATEASDEVLSGARPSHTFEKRLLRKDGSSFWVSVTISRARDGSFGISVIDDITARKTLEDDLRHAQKMEAVGLLAGGIAHDFNNVMTAVSGCADLLLSEIDEDDPRRSRVDVIAQSAARATDLTRQLLAFSRRQVLRLEAVDLADVVRGMEAMLARLLPPNVAVSFALADGAVVRIDRPQFEQVVLNLALNARDAMPDGGRLMIAVRADGDDAELSVVDEGVGMDETTQARVFEPFFTTKQSGTGLGLSTVDGIVGQSGGTIAVTSEPGRGTEFTIRLPRVDEPAVAPRTAPPAVTSSTTGRILLAEDEELVRRVTSEMLRRLGYDVVCAASGEEALELLAESVFDALVTDIAMTGMNGQTLSRRARETDPTLPVLFVSGYPAEVLAGDGVLAAGDEVLTKPFAPGELAERIELVRARAAELALV